MWYVGIDPGKSGGIAVLNEDGSVVAVVSMPQTDKDIFEFIETCASGLDGGNRRAAIEKVHSSPQMGVKSAFTFGAGFGGLKMALSAVKIPYREVSPQRWQADMGCMTKGNKNVSKAAAQQLFPALKITHAIADALLIAEWLRKEDQRGRTNVSA